MPISSKQRAEDISKQEKVRYVKSQGQTRDHHCHWPECDKDVPPAMWGCYKHWMMLPKYLRDKIWAAYRPGQETNWTPSRDYLIVAEEVQQWILEHYFDQKSETSSHFMNIADGTGSKSSPICVACNDTGKNSKGGTCVPCEKAGRIKSDNLS